MINQETMLAYDRISMCGNEAIKDFKKACEIRKIEYHYSFLKPENLKSYLDACKEVWDKWHTTNNFKVGDKVYVKPSEPVIFRDFIRARVTEISTNWGYHLRAFSQDLPGIYMFNQWDKDLIPRTSNKRKFLPPEEN